MYNPLVGSSTIRKRKKDAVATSTKVERRGRLDKRGKKNCRGHGGRKEDKETPFTAKLGRGTRMRERCWSVTKRKEEEGKGKQSENVKRAYVQTSVYMCVSRTHTSTHTHRSVCSRIMVWTKERQRQREKEGWRKEERRSGRRTGRRGPERREKRACFIKCVARVEKARGNFQVLKRPLITRETAFETVCHTFQVVTRPPRERART